MPRLLLLFTLLVCPRVLAESEVSPSAAPSNPAVVEQQLAELIAMRKEMRATTEQMQRQLAAFDERISSLETNPPAPQEIPGSPQTDDPTVHPASAPSNPATPSSPAPAASDVPSPSLRQANELDNDLNTIATVSYRLVGAGIKLVGLARGFAAQGAA